MLLCLVSHSAFGQACVEKAKEIEPQLPVQVRQQYEAKLIDARINLASENSADNLIWLGRRTAYLGRYKEAIEILSTGVEAFHEDARFFRHRGHRYITIRCFDLAIDDLKRAAQDRQVLDEHGDCSRKKAELYRAPSGQSRQIGGNFGG
jgi:tetratricopeptide (TPR) repeat protein